MGEVPKAKDNALKGEAPGDNGKAKDADAEEESRNVIPPHPTGTASLSMMAIPALSNPAGASWKCTPMATGSCAIQRITTRAR